MTEKEKAQELYDRFFQLTELNRNGSKECAKICIEEIMKVEEAMWNETKPFMIAFEMGDYSNSVKKAYLQEVLKELENLNKHPSK